MLYPNQQNKKPFHHIKSKLLVEYLRFLRDYQHVSEATIGIRRNYVSPFLVALNGYGTPSKIGSISPSTIHDYIIKTAKTMNRSSRKHLTSSLRSFIRFIHIKGYIARNLVDAVPIIATRKLDRLPRTLSWENVQKLLKAPDRSTSAGRRDYAILQLLATYGVRIGQITHLQLRDIEWHKGLFTFR